MLFPQQVAGFGVFLGRVVQFLSKLNPSNWLSFQGFRCVIRVVQSHHPKPHVITSLFPPSENQRMPAVLYMCLGLWHWVDEVDRKNGFSPSGSGFWCLSWSGSLVSFKAESTKLIKFSRILRIPCISFDRVADSSVGLNNPYCGLFLSCSRLRILACPISSPMSRWRSTTAQGSRVRHLQCKHARLVWSSRYLLAGQFKRLQSESLKRPSEMHSKRRPNRFDRRWRDGVPSTGRILCASCSQLNIKSLWGSHDFCHICRGYCNVAQFDHVITWKSWKIDISFSAGKQLLQQIPETHCENPEAEPYVGRDGIGKAFSLKLSSYRHEWQHLIRRPEMFHWSRSNLETDFFCCRLARKPTHGTNHNQET